MRPQPPQALEATVLFTDLRGFTATATENDPVLVFEALRTIYRTQVGVVRSCDGYIDKFTGDGMLAVFEGEGSQGRACAAAARIVDWARSHEGFGPFRPIPVGLGLHYGALLRGEFGDAERRERTVIGNVVNTAARICGAARAGEALVTEAVLQAAGPGFRSTGARSTTLKGLGDLTVHVLGRATGP